MKKKVKLTPDLEAQILAGIRAGGYPHVAAAAFGVPEATLDQWIEWGKSKKCRQPYASFIKKVEQAKAQARLRAEMKAMDEDPRFWLKNGPGKERPDSPGWAAMVRPLVAGNTNTINLFSSPDFIQFMATLRSVLAPFPDALTALTKALEAPAPEPIPLPPPQIDISPSQN